MITHTSLVVNKKNWLLDDGQQVKVCYFYLNAYHRICIDLYQPVCIIFHMYRVSYGHVEIGCAVHLVVHYTPLLDL